MKEFFYNIIESFKNLLYGNANKHQRWIVYGSFVFGVLLRFLFGTLSTIVLMIFATLFADFTYCYAPNKSKMIKSYKFELPYYSKFWNNLTVYLSSPNHQFIFRYYYYLCVSIIIFLTYRLAFILI